MQPLHLPWEHLPLGAALGAAFAAAFAAVLAPALATGAVLLVLGAILLDGSGWQKVRQRRIASGSQRVLQEGRVM